MSRDEQARELLRKHAGCAPHGLGQSVKTTAALRAIIEALRGASGGGKPFSRDDENGGVADAAAGDGAQYTAEALSTHAIDFLDRKADAWMMETGIARMVQSAATVFEKHAPADVLYRFNETLEALMHQTFVEGAFRAWSEIEEERTACTPDQFAENAKSSGEGRAGSGVAAIATERQRQIEQEGWTPEHDDEHVNGEMAAAALCYCWAAQARLGKPAFDPRVITHPPFWPWDVSWWKPKGPREDLVRAGALITAVIDRLDRAALARSGKGEGR